MEGVLQADPSKQYSHIQILSLIHNLYLAPPSIWIFSSLAANIIWLLVITRQPAHSSFICAFCLVEIEKDSSLQAALSHIYLIRSKIILICVV